MLKQKINKAAFDGLPDVLKAEYKPSANNADEYLLDSEEAREAVAARDREKQRADDLQKQIDTINQTLDAEKTARAQAEADAAKKKGDIPALEASWQQKLDAAKAESEKIIEGLKKKFASLLVTKEAERIAAAISTVPSLLAGVIAQRLSAEIESDVPFTRVLDKDGKPTSLSLADLQKEFVANPEYAAIIKANGASGGGAGGGSGGSGAGGNGSPSGKKLSEMSERERVQLYRDNPTEFKRLQEAERAAAQV